MLRHLSCHVRHLNPDDLVGPARSMLPRKSDAELMSDGLEYAVACVEDDHRLGPQTCGPEGAIDNLLRGRLLGAEHQPVLRQFRASQLSGAGQRVTRMHDRDNALTQTDLPTKPAVTGHVGKDTDIDPLIDDGIDDGCPVAHLDSDLDVRIKTVERGN